MCKRTLAVIAWLLVGLLPLQLMAGDAVGVLTNSGTVLIDSRQTGMSTAVFAGEVIETKNKSKAVINGKGRTVSLGENSAMRLGLKDFELQSGAVVVASTSAFVTDLGAARVITDSTMPSKFIATRAGDTVKVVTLEGVVYVTDGQQTTPVPATRGVNIGIGRKKDKGANTEDYPGARKPTWLTNDDIGFVILIAAGIAAGVTLAIVNSQNSQQPATPAGP